MFESEKIIFSITKLKPHEFQNYTIHINIRLKLFKPVGVQFIVQIKEETYVNFKFFLNTFTSITDNIKRKTVTIYLNPQCIQLYHTFL